MKLRSMEEKISYRLFLMGFLGLLFRTIGLSKKTTLHAHRFWHDENHTEAQHSTHHRKSHAGVA